MMENLYFDTIDRLLSIRLRKLNFYLAFSYFPFLIFIAITSHIVCEASILSSFTIFPLIIGAPMLMIPAIYYLRGGNYFTIREFVKNLDESNVNYDLESIFKRETIQLFYQEKLNDLQSVFNLISHKENNSQNCLCYKPNKKLSKRSIEKLEEFYNKEARKYFDIQQYELDFFIELLSGNTNLKSNEILLNDELSNAEISTLVNSIHNHTGIYQNRIQLLFKRFYHQKKMYGKIKWNSIKTTKSQCNSVDLS